MIFYFHIILIFAPFNARYRIKMYQIACFNLGLGSFLSFASSLSAHKIAIKAIQIYYANCFRWTFAVNWSKYFIRFQLTVCCRLDAMSWCAEECEGMLRIIVGFKGNKGNNFIWKGRSRRILQLCNGKNSHNDKMLLCSR